MFIPLIDNGFKKWQAACMVFLISAFFHEVKPKAFVSLEAVFMNILPAVRGVRSTGHLPALGLYGHVDAAALRTLRAALHERPRGQHGCLAVADRGSAFGHSHVLPRLLRTKAQGFGRRRCSYFGLRFCCRCDRCPAQFSVPVGSFFVYSQKVFGFFWRCR